MEDHHPQDLISFTGFNDEVCTKTLLVNYMYSSLITFYTTFRTLEMIVWYSVVCTLECKKIQHLHALMVFELDLQNRLIDDPDHQIMMQTN